MQAKSSNVTLEYMELDVLFWGITLGMIGKILLGIAVLMVHSKVVSHRGIDKLVLREMQHERNITIIALLMIIGGYILEMIAFGYLPF